MRAMFFIFPLFFAFGLTSGYSILYFLWLIPCMLIVALIPVGGFFTIDGAMAARIIKKIRPRITIPMHYRDDGKGFGFDVLSTIEPFVKCFDSVSFLNESSIDTSTVSKSGIIVLSPKALRNS